jgi:hypothetical protein
MINNQTPAPGLFTFSSFSPICLFTASISDNAPIGSARMNIRDIANRRHTGSSRGVSSRRLHIGSLPQHHAGEKREESSTRECSHRHSNRLFEMWGRLNGRTHFAKRSINSSDFIHTPTPSIPFPTVVFDTPALTSYG